MRTALLVAAVLIGWATALAATTIAGGPGHERLAVAALALCLLPAVGTLRLVERAAGTPAAVPVALLGAGVRMVVAVVGVVVLGRAATPGDRDRLAGWTVTMYVLTLVVESALAARAVRGARPEGGR